MPIRRRKRVQLGLGHAAHLVLFQANAPAGRPQLAADAAQQRRFAATGPAHDGHHLAARNLHVDSLQHRPAVITEVEVLDIDQDVVGQSAFPEKSRSILSESPTVAGKRQGYNRTNFIWNVAHLPSAKPLLLIVDDDSLISESLSFRVRTGIRRSHQPLARRMRWPCCVNYASLRNWR
jgi:hypothetical protein